MVIVVLQQDPPLSPTSESPMVIVAHSTQSDGDFVLQEDPPLSPTFRHLLLLFVLPLSLMVIGVLQKILHRLLHSDTFYGYVYFHSV